MSKNTLSMISGNAIAPEPALSIQTIKGLRDKIENIADELNTHIDSTGPVSGHVVQDGTKAAGLMSTGTYGVLVSDVPQLIRETQTLIKESRLPIGTVVWYYGDPNNLPNNWEVISNLSSSPMSNIAPLGSDGKMIQGVSSTSETPGTERSMQGARGAATTVTTLALYCIRKKSATKELWE